MHQCPYCPRNDFKKLPGLIGHVQLVHGVKLPSNGGAGDASPPADAPPPVEQSQPAIPVRTGGPMQQHEHSSGCLDCVRKDNQLELARRDHRDIEEERDHYRTLAQQGQTAQQQVAQRAAALEKQLEEAHRGHTSLDELLACPNCGPQDREKVEVAKKLAPAAFQPIAIGS